MRFVVALIAIAVSWCGNANAAPTIADKDLAAAETFIDSFYSFDQNELRRVLAGAPGSVPHILYYQGWAQGGNYSIVRRQACAVQPNNEIACPITVKDDLMKALEIDFNVTDTFHLTVSQGEIRKVTTSSDDLPEYYEAMEWVKKELPESVREPCIGSFAGGPTPGKCVQAFVAGFREFTKNRKH